MQFYQITRILKILEHKISLFYYLSESSHVTMSPFRVLEPWTTGTLPGGGSQEKERDERWNAEAESWKQIFWLGKFPYHKLPNGLFLEVNLHENLGDFWKVWVLSLNFFLGFYVEKHMSWTNVYLQALAFDWDSTGIGRICSKTLDISLDAVDPIRVFFIWADLPPATLSTPRWVCPAKDV